MPLRVTVNRKQKNLSDLLRWLRATRRRVHRTNAPVQHYYDIERELGEGKTAKVYLATSKRQQVGKVAIKVIPKDYLNTEGRLKALKMEMGVLKTIKHPNVIELVEILEGPEQVAIVMQCTQGGEVLKELASAPESSTLTERDVAHVIQDVLHGIQYLHARGITHRDVKPENILCRGKGSWHDGVVLIDFGLAYKAKNSRDKMTGMNGTSHYMAPEMFGRDSQYDCAIDLWAVGVTTYILLFGQFPFDAKFLSQVEDKIAVADYTFPTEWGAQVSKQAKDFIRKLLVVDAEDRLTAKEALHHPWIAMEMEMEPFSEDHVHAIASFGLHD